MTILKALIILFILFASSRAYLRYRDKSLNIYNLLLWILIWGAAIILVFFPYLSDIIASFLGLKHGTDTAFFLAIIILFYLLFRLYVKIDKIDKDVTTLTINISKALHDKNNQKSKENN